MKEMNSEENLLSNSSACFIAAVIELRGPGREEDAQTSPGAEEKTRKQNPHQTQRFREQHEVGMKMACQPEVPQHRQICANES